MTRAVAVMGGIWLASMVWSLSIQRTDFPDLWVAYTLAFVSYAWLVFRHPGISITAGLGLALMARVSSFYFEPGLSDDYFRFIWDGMLLTEGIHPMAFTPDELMQHPDIFSPPADLYHKLNHTSYHSVYPPVAQWIYGWSYRLNHLDVAGHILFLKGIALLADALIVLLLFHLLKRHQRSAQQVLVYALNPLIVLEFSGNLHLDNLMIAGVLAAVLMAEKGKTVSSGLLMSLSILSKLFSAMLLPFMPLRRNRSAWTGIIMITVIATFAILMFFFRGQTTWIRSIGLWFNTFEFNAGIYYLVRSFGYSIWGYNRIDLIGPLLACFALAGFAVLWWRYAIQGKVQWPAAMVFAVTIYLTFSTTIHPWYLALPLALTVLSGQTFPVAWTYLVYMSYSHYDQGGFKEQYILISAEYIFLGVWMALEWKRNRLSKEKPV